SQHSLFVLSSLAPRCRPPRYAPFPYTTLFRSPAGRHPGLRRGDRLVDDHPGVAGVALEPVGQPLETGGLHERLDLGVAHLFRVRSEEHTSELQSRENLVCRLLLEKKNNTDRKQ